MGGSEQGQRGRRDRHQVLRFEDILVDAELPSASKIDGNVRPDDPFHLTDAVVRRHGPVVHELALLEVPVAPRPTVIGRHDREQFQPVRGGSVRASVSMA